MALLKYCHDDLVSNELLPMDSATRSTLLLNTNIIFYFSQVKLPFEKLIHALRNFPEDAMDPDTLLPMAYSIRVHPLFSFNLGQPLYSVAKFYPQKRKLTICI